LGYRFKIEHANIVAYLTSADRIAPRLTLTELFEFIYALMGDSWAARNRQPWQAELEGTIKINCVPYASSHSTLPDNILFSSSQEWIQAVHDSAEIVLSKLQREGDGRGIVQADKCAVILSSLRPLFNQYTFFAMPVGRTQANDELRAFCESCAYSSGPHGLVLMPDNFPEKDSLEILDPFPGLALVAGHPEKWPGILLWSRQGDAVFLGLPEAYELYGELTVMQFEPSRVNSAIRRFHSAQNCNSSTQLLHLSDLHFGTSQAQEMEPYLSAHLQSISTSIGRVVITGDLFNAPKRPEAMAFQSFRASLNRQRGEDTIVIPGNHDQKWLGNFGSPLKELAKLEWSSLVIDDAMACVFFCFDSSREADLARGKITVQQRRELATLFDTKCLARPDIKDYLRIALIHHHPFTFETEKETLVSRGLELFGITDEYFLRMEDADSFLQWCAARNIGLILHGHKHVARYVRKQIQRPDNSSFTITSVGCGTSLGAEGKPVSYNTIRWNPSDKQWAVSFFADVGDGGGFSMQQVSLLRKN
jgi:UDP-2,3-diacylglucosamine pyrophosphatase LpxH